MSTPPAIPLRQPMVVPPAMQQAANDLTETLRDSRVRKRPSSVPADVWEIVQEMREHGGLFDLTVEIARLERTYEEIERLSTPQGESSQVEMLPSEAVRLKMKLAKEIATLKAKAADVTLKTKDIITVPVFKLIMDGFSAALRRNIPSDPMLVQRISDDMGEVMRAALSQARAR